MSVSRPRVPMAPPVWTKWQGTSVSVWQDGRVPIVMSTLTSVSLNLAAMEPTVLTSSMHMSAG